MTDDCFKNEWLHIPVDVILVIDTNEGDRNNY
jgi:hypothetical protein